MKTPTQNGLLTAAIFAGLLSLPATWMTIRNATIQITPNFSGPIGSPFDGSSFNASPQFSLDGLGGGGFRVTGLNGQVTLLTKFPIWLVVSLAVATCVFLLLNNLSAMEFPRGLLWSIGLVALVLTTIPLMIALGTGRASPGIGWLLGLVCALMPLWVLWSTPTRPIAEPVKVAEE